MKESFFTTNFLGRYIFRVFDEGLPRTLRRRIFIGSLLCLLVRRCIDEKELDFVSKRMKLDVIPALMVLPAIVASKFWDRSQLPEVLQSKEPVGQVNLMTDDRIWLLSKSLAAHVPPLLSYGTVQLMTTDAHGAIRALARFNEGSFA